MPLNVEAVQHRAAGQLGAGVAATAPTASLSQPALQQDPNTLPEFGGARHMEAAILCEAPRSLKPSSFPFLQFASLCTACAALPHLQKTGKTQSFLLHWK